MVIGSEARSGPLTSSCVPGLEPPAVEPRVSKAEHLQLGKASLPAHGLRLLSGRMSRGPRAVRAGPALCIHRRMQMHPAGNWSGRPEINGKFLEYN